MKPLKVGVVLGATITLAALAGCARDAATPAPTSEAVCFDTNAWRVGGTLLARTERESGDTVLIKILPNEDDAAYRRATPTDPSITFDPGVVYRYRSGHSGPDILGDDDWNKATGAVGIYFDQRIRLQAFPFEAEPYYEPRLRFRGRLVPTAGEGVVVIQPAPRKDIVAVLSSEFPRHPGPILSSGGKGRHYHQIFEVEDASPVGEPVLLSLSSEEIQLEACWTGDERFVLYYDVNHCRVCVVPGPR